MFVNRVPFLVSVARGLNLVTAEFTPSQTAKQPAAGITRMIALYACRGFQVGMVLIDNEFEKLQNLMPILAINTTAAKEHVPEDERKIRLIKERGRGILNTLPFKKMPRLMLIELVYHVVLWLNAFPANSGVSETLSPCEIIYRHKLDFAKHCKSSFGTYCKVHDEPAPTNTMATWSTPAIVLDPTGNLQGTYKFLSLATGKKVKRRAFTPYPMPDLVIKKVEAYGMLTALPGIFDFANRNGILFEWNEEVDDFPEGIIDFEDVVLYPSLAAEHPGVVLGRDQPLPSIKEELVPQGQAEDAAARNANLQPFVLAGVEAAPIVHANADELDDYEIDKDDGIRAIGDIPQQPPHAPLVVNYTDDDDDAKGSGDDDNDSLDEDDEDDDDSLDEDDDNEPAEVTNGPEGKESDGDQGVRRSRRRGKGITKKYANYSLLMAARGARRGGQRRALIHNGCIFFSSDDLSDAKPIPEEAREEFTLGVALVYYSMNAGIKKFKEKGEAGVAKELTQMHDMNMFRPIEVDSLTYDEKKKALLLLMFLKEKRDSSVKARMCADGRSRKMALG